MRFPRAATLIAIALAVHVAAGAREPGTVTKAPGAPTIGFMTLDPGHFHAALVQKEMYPDVATRVDVYAPLGSDLVGHIGRIAAFNQRADQPTAWALEIHTGPDFFERMLRERPGNVVVLSGRNRVKIDRLVRSVGEGLHVLADKPWILKSSDLPKLETALAQADEKRLVAYDMMTERYEITTILQRLLVNDADVFGRVTNGSRTDPAVYMESVHHLMKTVAGAPNIRPAWFFDTAEQGEGLNDIGTHLVDLVQWTLFPEQALDYRKDVEVIAAQRWPTVIPEPEFRRVTGTSSFPKELSGQVKNGALEYFCNTLVSYTVRGIHTTLNVIWDWEAPEGSGDRHFAVYKGTRSRVEVRQTKSDGVRPQLYVVPNDVAEVPIILDAVRRVLQKVASDHPGVEVSERGAEIHVTIPDALRVGHEAHFAQVTSRFLTYLRDRRQLPAWERPNMLAKYYVTTTGTELSGKDPPREAPRLAP